MKKPKIPLWVRREVYERFDDGKRQCECDYPMHGHGVSCDKIIQGKPNFQPHYGIQDIRYWVPTPENTVAVCSNCSSQINALYGI
jgi:hypothetical protein